MKYASDFRRMALDALQGNWRVAILTGFVASLIGATAARVAATMDWRIHTVEVNMISASSTIQVTVERPMRPVVSRLNSRR